MSEDDNAFATRRYAESRVGSFVRQRQPIDSHPIGEWVQVLMVVPSRQHLCWLVRLFDGDVDVWPISKPDGVDYEFRENEQNSWVYPRPDTDASIAPGARIIEGENYDKQQ